ncbi:MAG: hypothetical protein GWO86_00460, partial [Planctomycetes bacterium]|nr:hypothetical protein [Planctomycetota bacterium]
MTNKDRGGANMQPKRTALIWTAVLVCTFTVSPNSKAAPVPLDFIDTYSEVGVYAEAQVYGDVDGYGSDDYQDFWDASASAYAEGYITENDPPPPHEIPVYAQMDMDASLIYYDSTEYVEVFSSLYGYGEIDPMAYGGECYGQGDTLLQSQLTVGTSGSFPEGSGGLTLEVYADGYEYELYSDWGIHFFSDDPNNPIDE